MKEDEEEDFLESDELVIVEEDFVQDETIKGLKKKINKKIEEGWRPIESNPFLDTTVTPSLWTASLVYEELESELEEEEGDKN